MIGNNGAAAAYAGGPAARLSEMLGPKPTIEPDRGDEPKPPEAKITCSTDFFRQDAARVLDFAYLGRRVEVCLDLAPDADPIAVVMPWDEYRALMEMRDKIHSITGSMQRAAG
jgi:hypothetical protein